MIRRSLYRILLALHPPRFRRRFAGEMLWVFDKAAGDGEASRFCFDVAGSLLRQWMRQPMLWTVIGAAIGSTITMFWATSVVPHLHVQQSLLREQDVLVIAVISLLTVSLTLVTTVALFHSLRRRRL